MSDELFDLPPSTISELDAARLRFAFAKAFYERAEGAEEEIGPTIDRQIRDELHDAKQNLERVEKRELARLGVPQDSAQTPEGHDTAETDAASAYEPPVIGMKVRIMGWDDPLLCGAFIACLSATAQQPDVLKRFMHDTGLKFVIPRKLSPIERMIDTATGHSQTDANAKIIPAFADWVAKNVWGEE